MKVHAHRGYSSNYPENTMIAFQKALDFGADGIELDIRITSDGEYIIMHDTTVDRTTNGSGSVTSLTFSYIQSLDAGSWFSSEFAGEKVPTLNEVLTHFKTYPDFEINLHCNVLETEMQGIIDLIESHNLGNRCFIFSGVNSLLLKTKTLNPSLKCITGGLPTIDTYQSYLDFAINNGIEYVSYNAFNNTKVDLETMITNIKINNKKTYASYIYDNYYYLVPLHLNYGTDIILVNDVSLTIELINNPEKLSNARKILYFKSNNKYIKLTPYILKNNKYIKL